MLKRFLKKYLFIFIIINLVFIFSCKKDTQRENNFINEIKQGPSLDRVIFEVRTDTTIGLKDVAEGRADLMSTGVDGSVYLSLNQKDKEKLETYSVPSGSWSLLLNPVPNKAPYTFNAKNGKTYFNPFAIREVRYALNFLIDRKKLVDEILKGAGEVSYTQATPGQPGTYKYNLIPLKLGFTENGNEEKALKDIEAAMIKASELPENKDKLKKINGWWNYNNEVVTVKFVIRVDDPSGRLPAGNAIADLIEKTGIKVERLLYDRNKTSQIVYGTDPLNYEWNIVTEAWGAGATRAWWDVSLRQMYVKEGNYMPGVNNESFWNYDNREASKISDKNYNGWFLTADEYWKDNLRLQEIGLTEAVRIYLNTQTQFFVANKNRFNERMIYGIGDGINSWSIRTANIKPNTKGEKVLRVIQYSAQGALFSSPWDPVGVNGFSDAYSSVIIGACSDSGGAFESPSTAKWEFILGEVDKDSVKTGVVKNPNGDTKPLGTILVPENAELFNPYTESWEEGKIIRVSENGELKYEKATNEKVYLTGSFTPKYFKWHHGVESSMADIIYGSVFIANIVTKKNENDKYYDSAMAGRYIFAMDEGVGGIISNGKIISYSKTYWPMSENYQLGALAAGPKIGNPNRGTVIPLEINEAIMRLVVDGVKSKNVYTISQDSSLTPIDVKNPTCVSDIKEKLIEMKNEKYVPIGMEKYLTKEEAVSRYEAAIKFIDKYGHAYISNGPFFISKIDTKANYIELTAFRDYGYKSDYWRNKLATKMSRIEDIDIQTVVKKNEDLDIVVVVSSFDYPNNKIMLPDERTTVNAYLQLNNNQEKLYEAYLDKDIYRLKIPKNDLAKLNKGNYVIVFESFIRDETPSTVTKSFVLQ